MSEISLRGIDRGNSNENGIAEAASLIINVRKKGSGWEYVGDKIFGGADRSASSHTKGYFWHYKIKGWYSTDNKGNKIMNDDNFNKEEMLIAYEDNSRYGVASAICILTVSQGVVCDWFRDANGQSFFLFQTGEELLSIHSLNDIVIVDTDKNKYYFVWNEGLYTFVKLPDISNFEINVSSSPIWIPLGKMFTNEIVSVSGDALMELSLTGYAGGTLDEALAILKANKSEVVPIIKRLNSGIKEYILNQGYVWKGFRVVVAIELIDGSIYKLSNIVDFIDNFFSTKVVGQNRFGIRNNQRIRYKEVLGGSIRLIAMGTDYRYGTSVHVADEFYGHKNVKVTFSPAFYDIINKWWNAELIKGISVFITEPKDFLNMENIEISEVTAAPNTSNSRMVDFSTYTPSDNEMPFKEDVPYYKIGEFDIMNRATSFEIKSEFLKDVVARKPLLLEHDLSKKYVSEINNVYNGMIHKSSIKNLVYKEDLMCNLKTYSSSQIYLIYVDIRTKNKWIRFPIGENRTSDHLKLEFNTLDIQEANLIFTYTDGLRLFRKLELKSSTFTARTIIHLWYLLRDKISTNSFKENVVTLNGTTFREFNFPIYNYIPIDISYPEIQALPAPNYEATDNLIYDDTNRLQLSATENPFIYPSARSYRFGNSNNKVITCETATIGISDAKFGMLPLYVFTREGLWIMETANGDIAYRSQHLLENINCYDNPKLVHRVLGGVVFGAENGIYVVSGTKLTKISTPLEGRVVLQDVAGIEQRINGLSIADSAKRINNIMVDYFSKQSFCVYDKTENELLFIEPEKNFSIVLMLNDMCWAYRKDMLLNPADTSTNFTDYVVVDNDYLLVRRWQRSGTNPPVYYNYFYKLNETDTSKNAKYINNNAVVFASGVIMTKQYIKIEHIISRFSQITDTEFDSHILLIGSRDGIEWKVLNHSSATFPKSISGQQMGRGFVSSRYFQFVYIRIERGKQNTQNRKESYFERFSFEISNSDAEGKLR